MCNDDDVFLPLFRVLLPIALVLEWLARMLIYPFYNEK